MHLLDAPVSGGPEGARSGRLAIWVGGDREVFDKHKPVLDAIGDQARYIGDIGAGSVAKLVHNCAGYAMQAALAEVFTMGVKGGVEPLMLWEAMRSGAQGRSRTFDRLGDQFLINKYEPPAFALKLAHKDMTLATQLGRELGVPMRLANMAMAEMTEALNRGWDSQGLPLAHDAAGRAGRREDRRRSPAHRRGIRSRPALQGKAERELTEAAARSR